MSPQAPLSRSSVESRDRRRINGSACRVQPNPGPVGSSKDLCRPQHPRLRTIATLEHDLVALDHDQNDDIAFAAKWTTSFCRGDMC